MGIPLERNSGLITEGTHPFVISKAEEKASASSGEPQWVLTLQCTEQAGEDRGKEVSLFLSLSSKARFKIDELLDATEFPKQGTVEVHEFVGKKLRAGITHGEYNGRATANVFRMLPASSTVVLDLPKKTTMAQKPIPTDSSAPERRSAF